MEHLADQGVPVVAPVPSVDGLLAERFELEDGTATVAYCMTEAPGRIRRPAEWTDEGLVALGDLLGRAHAAARSFDPGPGPRRPDWTDPFFDPGIRLLGDDDVEAAWHRTRVEAAAHPAGGTGLLIHQDAHFWNLHVDDDDRLTLFDFDDCGYGTPEHDIAIVLFYWLLVGPEDEHAATRRFLDRVLAGHGRHLDLDPDWPEGMDRILRVREADIHLLLALEDEADWTDNTRRWMDGRRERILEGRPLLGRPLAEVVA